MTFARYDFPDRAAASSAAADYLAKALRDDLDQGQSASIAVSGGTTPVQCFEHLSQAALPWDRVKVTLTDERCVPADHAESNTRLVRERLLQANAAAAEFVALDAASLDRLDDVFSAVLLGMGSDGHFASIFPDMPNLFTALDPNNPEPCLRVETEASPLTRVTLTLARLCQSRSIMLLVFGDAKTRILDAPDGLPIAVLLRQRSVPVRVIWAP